MLLCDTQINILPTLYSSLATENLNDIDFDLSRSHKVKSGSADGFPINDKLTWASSRNKVDGVHFL